MDLLHSVISAVAVLAAVWITNHWNEKRFKRQSASQLVSLFVKEIFIALSEARSFALRFHVLAGQKPSGPGDSPWSKEHLERYHDLEKQFVDWYDKNNCYLPKDVAELLSKIRAGADVISVHDKVEGKDKFSFVKGMREDLENLQSKIEGYFQPLHHYIRSSMKEVQHLGR
jgi:hypothetical protein